MKFQEMPYERVDYDSTAEAMNHYIDAMKQSKNAEEFFKSFLELNKIRVHLQTMIILCQIRHTMDTSDPFYNKENDYWDEMMPKYDAIETRMMKVSLESEFRDALKEMIPETFFQLAECKLKSFSEEIIDEVVEENKRISEYGRLKASAKIPFENKVMNLSEISAISTDADRERRKKAYDAKMKFYADHASEFDRIYDEMVSCRDRMAHKMGYQNYVEMAYYRMNRLDYDQKMVASYRKAILNEVTPIACKIYEKQRERLHLDTLKYYDLDVHFLDGNPKPIGNKDDLIEAAIRMYHEMSPETADFIDLMNTSQLWDLEARDNKELGGYETEIPQYHVPFIFSNFNGTASDVNTLTHEAGHAFQTYLAKDIDIPDLMCPTMESAEIDSMSMEFFTYPWMDHFFGKDADKYRFDHLCGTITFLPYGVLVDHFQEEVYLHPQWSSDERKECWRKLEKMYMPYKNYDGCEILEKGCWWYQQGHIFQNPFYYIDYTLAQVCAQQFFIRFHKKDEQYWKDYLHLLKLGGTKSFTNLIAEVNLKDPFQEGTIRQIMASLTKILESMNIQ